MHMRIEYLVIAMLVFGASSAAFGQPGNGRHGASAGTPAAPVSYMQGTTLEVAPPGREVQTRQPEAARPHGFALPAYDTQADNSSIRTGSVTRMTDEERRMLRRQIDEAGHDIYQPSQ